LSWDDKCEDIIEAVSNHPNLAVVLNRNPKLIKFMDGRQFIDKRIIFNIDQDPLENVNGKLIFRIAQQSTSIVQEFQMKKRRKLRKSLSQQMSSQITLLAKLFYHFKKSLMIKTLAQMLNYPYLTKWMLVSTSCLLKWQRA